LVIWFIPVILIPAIWPAYAISAGEFQSWLNGIFYQTHRQKEFNLIFSFSNPLIKIVKDTLFKIDPILLTIGVAGLVFAAIKRDFFLLLWGGPFLILLYIIQYVSYWFLIPLIPMLCLAAAKLIVHLSKKISHKQHIRYLLPFAIISGIGIFGVVSTSILITTNMSSHIMETAAFLANYLGSLSNKNENVTLILTPVYNWIFGDVYNKSHVVEIRDHSFAREDIKTHKVILVVYRIQPILEDPLLWLIYNNAHPLKLIKGPAQAFNRDNYPYTSLDLNYEGKTKQQIRMGEFDKQNIIVTNAGGSIASLQNEKSAK
jgi:hypothetical protein